jgi:phosphosulfolactate phosphohydrolase-like enzyme
MFPFAVTKMMRGSVAATTVVRVGCVNVKIVASAAEAFELSSSNEKLHEPLLMPVKLIIEAVMCAV